MSNGANPMSLPFNLSVFIDKVDKFKAKMPSDQVTHHQSTIQAYKLMMKEDNVTPELLDSLSLEQIEWVSDMISYWPSYDSDFIEEDANHTGFQCETLQTGISEISRVESKIKKKVTFI